MSNPLPLDGRTVLVTGTLTDLTRDQARDAVTALGGQPVASVTRSVDLVVLGEGAGHSKTAKAHALRILVLPGETFAALVADPTSWDGQPLGMTFADYDAHHGEPEATVSAVDPNRDHWVGKVTHYLPGPDGPNTRQVRLRCLGCGHRWMRAELFGDDNCPRPEVPDTSAPWERVDA